MKVLHYVGILLFIARFAAAPAFGGAAVEGTIEDISRNAYLPAVQAALPRTQDYIHPKADNLMAQSQTILQPKTRKPVWRKSSRLIPVLAA